MSIGFDQKKAISNLKKHGVSFDEAATALLDPMALVQEDANAQGEARYSISQSIVKYRRGAIYRALVYRVPGQKFFVSCTRRRAR